MQPDQYEVKWARSRMTAKRASTNYEAKEQMRNSSDPADHRALTILEADQAAIAADLAARRAAGLYPYERPESVRAAEQVRAERAADTSTGTGINGGVPLVSEGERSAIDAAPPSLPSAFYRRQLEQLQSGLQRLGIGVKAGSGNGAEPGAVAASESPATATPSLVRVPEEIAGTVFPVYCEAPWDIEQLGSIPVSDAEIQDGYSATSPPLLGGPLPAVRFVADEQGIVGGIVAAKADPDDHTDDLHRASLKRLAAKKNREIAEWGTFPAISTQQNAKRGTE